MTKRKKITISVVVILFIAISVFLCVFGVTLSGRMTFKTEDEMMAMLQGKYRHYWEYDIYLTITINENGGEFLWYDKGNTRRETITGIVCNPMLGTFNYVYDDDSKSEDIILLKNGDIRNEWGIFEKIK